MVGLLPIHGLNCCCLLPDLSSDLSDLLLDLADLLADLLAVVQLALEAVLAVAAEAEAGPVLGLAARVLQLSVLVPVGELVLLE